MKNRPKLRLAKKAAAALFKEVSAKRLPKSVVLFRPVIKAIVFPGGYYYKVRIPLTVNGVSGYLDGPEFGPEFND